MPVDAFLDDQGNVLAIATIDGRTISEVQKKVPDVTEKVVDAPDELKALRPLDPRPEAVQYHRRTSVITRCSNT